MRLGVPILPVVGALRKSSVTFASKWARAESVPSVQCDVVTTTVDEIRVPVHPELMIRNPSHYIDS